MEKVSIISPCYNGRKYISKYLESVLNQTYKNIELILVDDASSDNTGEIVLSFVEMFKKNGLSLVYIRLNENKGQAAAINRGLDVFTGEYVTWMDSDDIYYTEAIEKKVCYLEQNKDVDFVLNYGEVVSEDNLDVRINILKRSIPKGNDNLFKDLIEEKNVVFAPGTIMVRSKALKKSIPSLHIYESREGQNWQLMLPLAFCCKYGYLNEVLFKYVVHKDSHSHTKRDYYEQVKRRENFYILKKETINNIPYMSSNDKEIWDKFNYCHEIHSSFILSIKYFKIKDWIKLKRELKKMNYRFSINDNFMIFYLISFVRKIKNI